jgi:hypothetical protein
VALVLKDVRDGRTHAPASHDHDVHDPSSAQVADAICLPNQMIVPARFAKAAVVGAP